ncbi:MAG: zinc-ribbon domain-containing protein, partial [Chloroflexi bacterium]|nr:zinc-ribbon domain-containing protein [Chloroflexota bacterium]
MKCPNCQTTNPDGAKFCLNCGNALSLACPSCGTPYAPGAKFCHNCGHALAPPPAPGGTIAPRAKRSGGGEGDEARLQKFIPKELAAKLESARANR